MSQPPEYPGQSPESQGGNQGPSGYPPPPPPPGYGAPPPPPPPPGYGPPQGPPGGQPPGGYSAPGYSAPPPPPPPGYAPPGAPPAGYPPQAGWGGPPGSDFSVGNAFSWAWNKFTQNAMALVVPLFLYGLVMAAVTGIPLAIAFATGTTTTTIDDYDYGASYETTANFSALGWILIVVGSIGAFAVAMYLYAGLTTASLDIADGRPVSIGTFFKPRNVGGVILTTLLLAIPSWVLTCTLVGPLLIAFFGMFAIPFVVDRSLSPVDAIKASFTTVRGQIGNSALSYLVQYAAVLVGYIACVIGMVVGVPVASLIQVYTYRKLTGGQVVEVGQPGPPAGLPPGPPPGQPYR